MSDRCLSAPLYLILSVLEVYFHVKLAELPRGSCSIYLYYFRGGGGGQESLRPDSAGVVDMMAMLDITVACICDLHLVFGSGPGWLRWCCS